MKAVVAHHLWSRVGGGELVNAYVVKTLLEAGHEVIVVSTFSFDKKKYVEWFNIDLGDIKTYTLLPTVLPLFGIYQRLVFYVPLKKAVKKEKPDIVFIDNELYKPILKLREKMGYKLLEYIHFPFHAIEDNAGKRLPEEYKEAFREYFRKYEKGLWRYYFKFWLKLHKRVARDNPFKTADVVLANSKYIARLIKILWQGDAIVLNPPVKVRDFEPYNRRSFEERDDAVVMIGRISPEKRVEDVIDAIALTETKPILRVVGGLIPLTLSYKRSLEKRAKERGVRIEFYPNASREELIRIAASSKVFVHATVGEHFGIAIVEGMAAGCPVIVHRSGGPYEDITDYGRYGLVYSSIEELAEKIDRLMQPKTWKHYHMLSLERAKRYSEEEFAKKFLRIIENV